MIWNKWLAEPLSAEEEKLVFEIDDALLYHEFLELMDTALYENGPALSSCPEYSFGGFQKTAEEYLQMFLDLHNTTV